MKPIANSLDQFCINTIRNFAMDTVQMANKRKSLDLG